MYIGQTKNELDKRFGIDGKNYTNCKYFWDAIQKYGWSNFEHILIVNGLTKDVAAVIEAELIVKYRTINPDYGYNGSAGNGETNRPVNEIKLNKSLKNKVVASYISARKSMSIQIDESLQDAFREKCKSENLKYSEVAEALLQSYVDGKMHVEVETKYRVTPKDL